MQSFPEENYTNNLRSSLRVDAALLRELARKLRDLPFDVVGPKVRVHDRPRARPQRTGTIETRPHAIALAYLAMQLSKQ